VLSLCAGDGRDVATAAAGHARAADLTGCLVELDQALAAAARENLAPLGSGLEVRAADAGDPATWADAVPVDLLLLCGIFGNVADGTWSGQRPPARACAGRERRSSGPGTGYRPT
jgi:hypothetical protein